MSMLSVNLVTASELTDDYFDIAQNYFHSNNYAKALEYLDLIISIEPNNLQAKTLRDKISPPPKLAPTETEQAQTAKILEDKTTNTEIKPDNVKIVDIPKVNVDNIVFDSDYYNKKGMEFYNNQDYDSATQYFYKAITVNKKNMSAYNNLGMTYAVQNKNELAIKFFQKANSINKNYTQPLVNLANLYKKLGNNKKRVDSLQKAIKQNSNDYLAYYYLGDYYREIELYPKSIANFKECVKINQKFPQVYLGLAMSFFETEEFNYAILALQQYLELCPNSDVAYFLMSKSAMNMNRNTEAKTYIENAMAIKSLNEYKIQLAKLEYYSNDYISALTDFESILQTVETPENFNYAGLCNYKLKNIDAGIANFKKAIELDGLRPIYYYNLAQCYKTLGDKKTYVKYVNTATQINPINYQDYIDLSYIYTDNGNTGYAIRTLDNGIKRFPNAKALYLSKLKIYASLGDDLNYNKVKDIIEERFNKNETLQKK